MRPDLMKRLYADEQYVTNIGLLFRLIEASGLDDPRPTREEAIDAMHALARAFSMMPSVTDLAMAWRGETDDTEPPR